MVKRGFLFKGKWILFIDGQGKDISYERWRAVLYYHRNFALTHFLNSQAEYDQFLKDHKPHCYSNVEDFDTAFNRREGVNNAQR